MGSYEDLRNILSHIKDVTKDANAWRQGLSPQDMRDVDGWLKADGSGGWTDPMTGVEYVDRSRFSDGNWPQVPDEALNRMRDAHPWLFDRKTGAPMTPPPGAPGTPPVAPAPVPAKPGVGEGFGTDEENSGRAAEAIKKVQADLATRTSNLKEADAKLTEVMLSVKAARQDGVAAVQEMQKDVVGALNDPKSNLDSGPSELQFLKFLRDKTAAASDLVKQGKLTDADAKKMAMALADFYNPNSSRQGVTPPGGQQPPAGTDPANPGTPPGSPGLLTPDPGVLGPAPEMPPSLELLGLGDGSMSDALREAATALGPALQGITSPFQNGFGGGGGGFDVGSITKPIGDAISAAAEHGSKDESGEHGKDGKDDDGKDDHGKNPPAPQQQPPPQQPQTPQQPQPPVQPAPGAPDPALTPPQPSPPSTSVDLGDGTSATAEDVSRAEAGRAVLKGTPVTEAYRLNHLSHPPPGTVLTNNIPNDQLRLGDYAMYRDKLVFLLGQDKWVDASGQVQPMRTLPQGTDFMGFGRPIGVDTPAAAPAPGAPAPVSAAAHVPAAGLPPVSSVPGGHPQVPATGVQPPGK